MTRAPRLRLRSARLLLRDCRTRLPFRFGIHTLTIAPLSLLEASVEIEGSGTSIGWSSDLLVPKWFEKDPKKSPRDDVLSLIASTNAAIDTAIAAGDGSLFEIVLRTYRSRMAGSSSPPLLTGLGVSLVERALLDATCRARATRFHDLLRDDLVGFDPAQFDPATEGWRANEHLPREPSNSVTLRHTVGLLDDLVPDAHDANPRQDGEPRSLIEAARRDRLRHFKIKLSGDPDADRERLLAIATILDLAAAPDWRFTLDGNEQYTSLGTLADLLDELRKTPRGGDVLSRLLYIEQPLPRAASLDSTANRGIERFDRFGGLILDEADGEPSVFGRALQLGYRGVSMKNCKGVFRALTHRARIDLGGSGFQSGEDLTNLPVVALHQDLATAATLHLPSIERNGHHYFRGLDHLDASTRVAALTEHGDLYESRDAGVFLRVEDGRLSLRSIVAKGFGTGLTDLARGFVPAEEWSPPNDL